MRSSISRTLFEWMKEKRIITAVAKRMGIAKSTLASELRSSNHQAKLGADELVPLFQAIRKMGYESELRGIVRRFMQELEGEHAEPVTADQYSPQLLTLVKCIGVLSESAARIDDLEATPQLVRLKTMIRTEILPAICKMEDIVESRLAHVRRKAKTDAMGAGLLSEELQPSQAGA